MALGIPLAVKWSSHLTLRDRWVGLGMHTLAVLPPILNGRLGLVSYLNFPWLIRLDVGRAAISFFAPLSGIDIISFLVTSLIVKLTLINDINIIWFFAL